MERTTESNTVTHALLMSNALLLIGSHEQVQKQIISWLQQVWCSHNACTTCITCLQIQNFQHHGLLHCTPSGNNYALADIDAMIGCIQFVREPDEHFFVILAHADRLPAACANRLLKTLEEPPIGYHFMLCTPSVEAILPTIQSRCMVHQVGHAHSTPVLWDHFIAATANPLSFLQALQATTIAEHEIVQLIHELSGYWSQQYKERIQANKSTESIELKLDILHKAFEQPVAPGSSKIVLRNLYLLLQG